MEQFTIEIDGTGKYVLIDHQTGQKTTYATLREAEHAKVHLTRERAKGSRK
jgi:murein DD-endopeptidase MepM/ murein hydrolase activator NlpD